MLTGLDRLDPGSSGSTAHWQRDSMSSRSAPRMSGVDEVEDWLLLHELRRRSRGITRGVDRSSERSASVSR